MGKRITELKTTEDVAEAFNRWHEMPEKNTETPDYYTLNIGYDTAYIDGQAAFASYGEAKGKALEYLVRYQDRLNATPIKKSESKEYKVFVETMTKLSIDELVKLRDKLIDEGDITIEESYY